MSPLPLGKITLSDFLTEFGEEKYSYVDKVCPKSYQGKYHKGQSAKISLCPVPKPQRLW